MSKRLTTASIKAKVMGQEVEIVVAYPAITVRTVETGQKRSGRISKSTKRTMIFWSDERYSPEDAELEAEVLSVCREAQLVWAREDRLS